MQTGITYVCDMNPAGDFEARFINYSGKLLYLRTDLNNTSNTLIPIPNTKRTSEIMLFTTHVTGAQFYEGSNKIRLDVNDEWVHAPKPMYKSAVINIIPYEEYYQMYELYNKIDPADNPLNFCCTALTDPDSVIKFFLYRGVKQETIMPF
jgi:hypothetical protein